MESLRVRDRIFYHKEVLNENCHPAVRCRRGIARGVICDCMRLWRLLPFHPRRGLRLSSRDACASEILKHIRRNQYIFNDGAGFQALSRMERNS